MRSTYHPDAMRHPPALSSTLVPGPPRPEHLLLINPFYAKDPVGSFGKHVLTPSLALTGLAGATPRSWSVRIWDENLLQGPPPHDPFPLLVGITVHLTFARRAIELARWYRQRGAVVVMGGPHVVACPEELRPHTDILCFGNGVAIWPQILVDVAAGAYLPTYHGTWFNDYAQEPEPRRDLLPPGAFLTEHSMIATRGCRNRCDFCHLSTRGLQMPCSHRRAGQVAAAFAASPEPFGVFIDNNLGADRDYLARLCRELAGIGKIWTGAVTLDVTDRPDLVRDMAQAGCRGVFIGFESLGEGNLRANNKQGPDPADWLRRVGIFREHGIQVNGSFVFGFDGDGPRVFEDTVDWIEAARLTCATFHILTPYPGTPLFRRLQGQGRLLHTDWELYDTAHCVFEPARMTPSELEHGYRQAYRRLFSLPSILARRPAAIRAVPQYLLMTWLYKRNNRLWAWLIRKGLTHALWRPLLLQAGWSHRRRAARLRRRALTAPVVSGETDRAAAPRGAVRGA